jgi:hypothetical protein
MDNLISEVRKLIDDTTAPYDFDDTTIERYLNKDRGYVEDMALTSIDTTELVYELGFKNIADLVLKDNSGSTISAADYDFDYINGIITFSIAPDSINATFTYHDLYNTVAELWLARASQSKFSGKVKLADEELPADKNSREFCIQQYWFFKRSKSFRMERG